MTILDHVREQRALTYQPAADAIAAAEAENRDLTPEEAEIVTRTVADLTPMDARIEELSDLEVRNMRAVATLPPRTGNLRVKSEPLTYQRGNTQGPQYFRDLGLMHVQKDEAAMARLRRHSQEMDVEWAAREERNALVAERELRALPDAADAFFEGRTEQRANPSPTDGSGGYFVPPIWLIDEFIGILRAGRTFANSVRQMPLPMGTDSVNIPKLSVGTLTGAQTANGPVTSRDITDTFVNAKVVTLAGQQDVARQLLDQSPINISDQVIFPDLLADYNMRVDIECWQGPGTGGRMLGIDNMTGGDAPNSITYTDASPTGPEFYLPLAQAVSQVARKRYQVPTAFFMHPIRWYWLASQLDTQNRPLVVPADNGPFNAEALQLGVAAEGPVGRVLGLPILMDPNITQVDGAGTNQDRTYAIRTSDLFLFEGQPRVRVMDEVLSGTMQVRFQLWNYLAFMPNRFPQSISIISGTGLTAPSGF